MRAYLPNLAKSLGNEDDSNPEPQKEEEEETTEVEAPSKTAAGDTSPLSSKTRTFRDRAAHDAIATAFDGDDGGAGSSPTKKPKTPAPPPKTDEEIAAAIGKAREEVSADEKQAAAAESGEEDDPERHGSPLSPTQEERSPSPSPATLHPTNVDTPGGEEEEDEAQSKSEPDDSAKDALAKMLPYEIAREEKNPTPSDPPVPLSPEEDRMLDAKAREAALRRKMFTQKHHAHKDTAEVAAAKQRAKDIVEQLGKISAKVDQKIATANAMGTTLAAVAAADAVAESDKAAAVAAAPLGEGAAIGTVSHDLTSDEQLSVEEAQRRELGHRAQLEKKGEDTTANMPAPPPPPPPPFAPEEFDAQANELFSVLTRAPREVFLDLSRCLSYVVFVSLKVTFLQALLKLFPIAPEILPPAQLDVLELLTSSLEKCILNTVSFARKFKESFNLHDRLSDAKETAQRELQQLRKRLQARQESTVRSPGKKGRGKRAQQQKEKKQGADVLPFALKVAIWTKEDYYNKFVQDIQEYIDTSCALVGTFSDDFQKKVVESLTRFQMMCAEATSIVEPYRGAVSIHDLVPSDIYNEWVTGQKHANLLNIVDVIVATPINEHHNRLKFRQLEASGPTLVCAYVHKMTAKALTPCFRPLSEADLIVYRPIVAQLSEFFHQTYFQLREAMTSALDRFQDQQYKMTTTFKIRSQYHTDKQTATNDQLTQIESSAQPYMHALEAMYDAEVLRTVVEVPHRLLRCEQIQQLSQTISVALSDTILKPIEK